MPPAGRAAGFLVTPTRYCQELTRRSGSSFHDAMRLFPAPKRRAMYALYAFCRSVDDVVDCCQDPVVARLELDWWRAEVARTFAGVPQHPISRELLWAHSRFDLDPAPFFAILDGMTMDLEGRRFSTLADLELYCCKVAVAVGQVAMRIFGLEKASLHAVEEDRFAHHLGVALQLTNVLRDVAEDLRMGRIYLPLDMLLEAGIAPERLLAGTWLPELQGVLARLATVATEHFQQVDRLASTIGRRRMRPALAMGAIYQHYLHVLQMRHFNVFEHPVTLGLLPRLWISWKTWLREG
ncbi:MAG: presqualene diphosphate synthase HpnD [Magnetococcus sp. DMHC-1]|nr:presqualene diphosphate synthase HpnD [Magnetococcales bacterium]